MQNWKGLASNSSSRWLGVIWVSSTVINIGLLKLPLDIRPKLAVGQWIASWSGFPGGSSSRGKLGMLSHYSCLIYRTWKSSGRDFEVIIWGASYKGMGPFLYGWHLKRPCKDFNLTIRAGIGWTKWLRNRVGKGLHLIQLFLHYIFVGESFIG